MHYTPIYGKDGTPVGYTVGVGGAVEEENIVIPEKHDGLPVLRIGFPEDFFEPNIYFEKAYNDTDKFYEEFTAYVEGLGYDPQQLENDEEEYEKVLSSYCQKYTFVL